MSGLKSMALGLALVALVASLCIDWTRAQKTAGASFQQQRVSSSGSNPNSVYGGYQTQQRPAALASPQRRPQQAFAGSKQSNPPPVYQQQQQPEASASDDQQAEADAEPASYGSVNGQPGQDFPNYVRVPKTSFTCDGVPYEYGMYADEETGCQAYHLCYNGRKDSFLCGPGTVFNQRILHCDYWYSVDCAKSSQYYSSNAYMGSSQPEPGPAQASSGQTPYRRNEEPSASANRPVSSQRGQAYKGAQQQQQQQQIQEAY